MGVGAGRGALARRRLLCLLSWLTMPARTQRQNASQMHLWLCTFHLITHCIAACVWHSNASLNARCTQGRLCDGHTHTALFLCLQLWLSGRASVYPVSVGISNKNQAKVPDLTTEVAESQMVFAIHKFLGVEASKFR